MWRLLRTNGYPICSSWIDESGPGQTHDWPGLWQRCIAEIREADCVLLSCEAGEVLRGALVEVGVAIALGVPVIWYGPELSICHHPSVTISSTLHGGLTYAKQLVEEQMKARRDG
jgi:hypothetical protein